MPFAHPAPQPLPPHPHHHSRLPPLHLPNSPPLLPRPTGTPTSSRAPLPSRLRRAARHCWQHEPLLLATLAGVATGVVLGTGLSFAHLPPLALELIGLPGQLLMRTLKMLVLPLITASVMSGAPLGGWRTGRESGGWAVRGGRWSGLAVRVPGDKEKKLRRKVAGGG